MTSYHICHISSRFTIPNTINLHPLLPAYLTVYAIPSKYVLCIKGYTLSYITRLYNKVQMVLILPPILKILHKQKNSLFYYIPNDIINVILNYNMIS